MKRKGFTLVELLATITVLGLIITIIVPAVSKNITNSRKKSYDKVIDNIITVTKRYALENTTLLPDEINSLAYIELGTLIDENLFDTDKLVNPITEEELDGYILIQYKDEEYKYEFLEGDFYEDKTLIEKSTNVEDSYVGYYADVNNDGEVDGIIFADLVTGATGDGYWSDGNGYYNIPTIESELVKDYYIEGEYTGDFGTKPVVTTIKNEKEKDRFYVLALEDFNSEAMYYWYYGAFDNLPYVYDFTNPNFGEGYNNTNLMINKWNMKGYGPINLALDNNNYDFKYKDLWNDVQNYYNLNWFVPSQLEWAAFGGEIAKKLNITSSNYNDFGLNKLYWSSSINHSNNSWSIDFQEYILRGYTVKGFMNVRLATIF